MKTQIMATLACLMAISVFSAPNAHGDDFAPPPWDRGAFRTTAMEWEFLTDANGHTGPDGNSVVTVPAPAGSGTVSIYGNTTHVSPIWSIGDGDGQWSAPANDPISMEFQIENWPDYEPVKHLRVQVTYNGLAPSISGLSAIHQDGFFSTSTHVATTPFAPNQLLFEYDIFPNPVFELFHLDVPPGTSIDQVVIDTISIPEPTTIGLMGFGALAFIKRSRRK